MVDPDPIGPRPAEFPDQLVCRAVTQMFLLAQLPVTVLHPGAGGEGRNPEAGIATTGFTYPVVSLSMQPSVCIPGNEIYGTTWLEASLFMSLPYTATASALVPGM